MNKEMKILTDLLVHIQEVQSNLEKMCHILRERGLNHDKTKFCDLEFDSFVKTHDKFKNANFGTKEYKECVDMIRPAIDHHHKNNSHHVDFYEN